jgi:outer membrane protein insertion porin family
VNGEKRSDVMKNSLVWIGTSVMVAVLAGLASAPSMLYSQQIEAATQTVSYEGQKVSSVQLAGQPDGDVKKLRALITQPINAPYEQVKIDETAAALKSAGPFKDVEVQVAATAEGVQVIFILKPAAYFGIFTFPRAENTFSYTRLLQKANYSKQLPYSQEKLEDAESSLLNFFHQEGFFMATVEPKLQTDQVHGVVNVMFDINLKRHSKFGNVIITGAPAAQAKRLGDGLQSFRARIRGARLKPGSTYSLKRLESATAYLQQLLGSQHFLAARVKLVSTVYNAETNRTDITFDVTEGPRTEINVAGARIWKRTQRRIIPMYQENAVDADLVNEGEQNLSSYFQSKGFFDVKVESHVEKQTSGVTVLYQIERGKRGRVQSLEFHGNDHFSDNDLKTRVPVTTATKFVFFLRGKYSEQLVRKGVKNIETLYSSAGYSQVKVTPKVERDGGNLRLTYQVVEGVRDLVKSLQVEGNKSLSEQQLAPKGMNLEPGKPYSAQLLNRDRDRIMAAYLDHGYLTMTLKARVEHTKEDPHHVEVTYEIDEGPQMHTVSVASLGERYTRPNVIMSNANIPTGKPLSETSLLQGESQLYTLGIFDWASVDTRRPVTDDPDAEVLMKVHESKRNTITYGFGFQVTNRGGSIPSGTVALPGLPPVGLPSQFTTSEQTFWGPQGSVDYTRRNFMGRAETLNASVFAGRLNQRVGASWSDPSFLNSHWTSTVTISGQRTSENPIYTARLVGAGLQFQHFLDKNRQKTLIFRYDFQHTTLTNIVIPDLVLPQDQNVRLSSLSAAYSRDTRDNPLDAHHGIYQSFQLGFSPDFLGSSTNFARFLGQTAYYRSLTHDSSLVWANSLRLGLEPAFGGAHIPISESFFSGGGSTLRGFNLNGAGPQRTVAVCPTDDPTCGETIAVPVGGNMLVILNTELRFPLGISMPVVGGALGGAVFYDGGNVYTAIRFSSIFSDYTNTLGAGLRYKTPIGPIRFDVGYLVNAPPGLKSVQLFVTLGQAF